MDLFSGYNTLTLDSQKRLAIPARYRERLERESNNQVVVTLGFDTAIPHLDLYDIATWDKKIEVIDKLPNTNAAFQAIKRRVIGYATTLGIDKNARILIPQKLRELVNIEKDVVFSGVGQKFEIFEPASWERAKDIPVTEDSLNQLPEDVRSGL